ncbi:MAG: ATP synthase F1 subunit delta [Longimicrobiales bacterium]
MTQPAVARNYADALFELGKRTAEQDRYAQAFETVAALIEGDQRVRDFLGSPKIDLGAKKEALVAALRGRVPQLFLNFILVTLDKRRHRLLPNIAREYRLLLDEHLGRLHVQVTLAHEPDELTESEVTSELTRILGKDVIAHVRIDENIIGGIMVRYGDRVLDGSLRRRLMSLRHLMLAAALPQTVTS